MSFYRIAPSPRTAFVDENRRKISYEDLASRVDVFRARLSSGRGILLLECDGHVRQYVAYLAALSEGIPVVLAGDAEGSGLVAAFSIKYRYRPKSDDLVVDASAEVNLHPDLAVLLSTSGSTGAAKSVKLSKGNLEANAASIVDYLEITPDDRAPLALPFHYSYGMSVVNSYLLAGASLVVTEGSVIDAGFWDAFEATGCTSFAGVPHSFELMERQGVETARLRSLRYMTQAGGKLASDKIAHWTKRSRTEAWKFFVMYGQTEASPRIAYLPPAMAAENPGCIGVPVPGGEITVVDEKGSSVPDETTGELVYRGANTMMGYALSDADLSAGQGDDRLFTGDLVIRHSNGMFEIVGRKNRFVKPFGLRVSLDEVERHLQVAGYDAVCAAEGDTMVVFVPPSHDGKGVDSQVIADDLEAWLAIPKSAFAVEKVGRVPRTASGKVDGNAVRAMLAERLVGRKASEQGEPEARSWVGLLKRHVGLGKSESVRTVFARHFPGIDINPDQSFVDLGGDSLSYLSMAIDLEHAHCAIPPSWQTMPLRELEAMNGRDGLLSRMDTPTFFRGLAIALIVMGHVGLFNYGGGGAFALFLIAGFNFSALTVPPVLTKDSVRPIGLLMSRVAMLTVGYGALNYAMTGYGDLRALLMVSNGYGPDVRGGVWFIEVYLQMLILFATFAAIPRVRQSFRRDKMRASLVAGSMAIVLMGVSELLFDTNDLYRRLPHLLAWVFAVGMAAEAATDTKERLAVTAAFILGCIIFRAQNLFFLVAVPAIIWLPSIQLPRILSAPIRQVGSASLLIYLSHFQFAHIAERLFGPVPLVEALFALLGGVVAWSFYMPIDNWVVAKLAGIGASRKRGGDVPST